MSLHHTQMRSNKFLLNSNLYYSVHYQSNHCLYSCNHQCRNSSRQPNAALPTFYNKPWNQESVVLELIWILCVSAKLCRINYHRWNQKLQKSLFSVDPTQHYKWHVKFFVVCKAAQLLHCQNVSLPDAT